MKDIVRQRLHRQHIARPVLHDPAEVVAALGAMQAQEYALAKWAVGLRASGLRETEVEAAFNRGEILRTHVLRPTWHFVAPADIRWVIALTAPRVHQANAFMYRKCGLDTALFRRSDEAIARALEGGRHLTREALQVALAAAGIEADGFHLAYLVMHAELEGLICSGPRQGNQFTYALLDERVAPVKKLDTTEALAALASRFFTTRGPATVQDFCYWSGLTQKEGAEAANLVRSSFQTGVFEGREHFFPAGELPSGDQFRSTFLMPDYDEYGMSYKDKTALSHPGFTGSLVFNRLLMVEGRAVGSWKRTLKKDLAVLDFVQNVALTPDHEKQLNAAAEEYGAFIEKKIEINRQNAF